MKNMKGSAMAACLLLYGVAVRMVQIEDLATPHSLIG
jgi:hypothetical protein